MAGSVWHGLPEFETIMDRTVADAHKAAKRGANAAAALVEKETKLVLSWSTHRRGEQTDSAPGEPPALVSGQLRRSMRTVPAEPYGPTAYIAKVGPTAVYARIQELGGRMGKNPRHGMWRSPSTMPSRPYLEPTVRKLVSSGALSAAFRSGYGAL